MVTRGLTQRGRGNEEMLNGPDTHRCGYSCSGYVLAGRCVLLRSARQQLAEKAASSYPCSKSQHTESVGRSVSYPVQLREGFRRFLGSVRLDRDRLSAGAFNLLDDRRGRVGTFRVCDGYVRSVRGQTLSDCRTDAARAARNEGNLSFEFSLHSISPILLIVIF